MSPISQQGLKIPTIVMPLYNELFLANGCIVQPSTPKPLAFRSIWLLQWTLFQYCPSSDMESLVDTQRVMQVLFKWGLLNK